MVFQQGWSAESILGIAQVLRTLRFLSQWPILLSSAVIRTANEPPRGNALICKALKNFGL